MGLAAGAAASGALLVAALLLADRGRLGVPCLDGLAVLFLWSYLASLLVLVLGLAGLLWPGVAFATAGGAAVLTVAWRGRVEAAAALRTAAASVGRLTHDLRRALAAHPALVGGALVLAGLQALRIAVHAWVLPPYVWDALSYRLPRVAEWIQRGEVALFETPSTQTRWPATHELLQTWFALFPHHDVLADAASVPAYLLATGSTYAIARALGAARGLASLAALAYAFVPAVALHAASANNDLPVAALYLLVTALLLHLADRRVPARPVLLLAALALAQAVGTKAYIVFLAPGLLVVVLCAVRIRRRAPPAAARPEPRAPPWLLGGLAGGALLLGGYWYARNWVVFGNPFSPTELRLFGHLVFDAEDPVGQQGTFSLAGLAKNLSMLKVKMDDAGPFHPDLLGITGWGWLVGPGLAVLAHGLAVCPTLRWLAAAFGVSLLSLLAWVTPDWWNLRFALWFPALFAVAFALAVGAARSRSVRCGLLALATAALLLNLAGTLTVADLTPARWRALLALPATERSSATVLAVLGGGRLGDVFLRAIERVPPAEPLGYHVPPHHVIYPLYGADLARRLRYVPLDANTRLAEALDRRAVRHLFIWRPGPAAQAALDRAVARGELVQVDRGLYARAP
jgi:hypothetical protein